MTVGVAEGVDRGAECVVGTLVGVDQPGQRRGDPEVEPVALGVERIGNGRFDVATSCRGESGGRSGIDGAPSTPGAAGDGLGALDGAGLGCRHEALKITESIAPVASRVDPVVAQPARVAPRADRVRMHTKELGGLGDRQGRVRGSSGE